MHVRTRSLLILAGLLAGPGMAVPGELRAAGSGERLILLLYGDTRPNFYPFGCQRKHRAIADAMVQLDRDLGREVDGVVATGDFVFVDVPFTDRDWAPAWEALDTLRRAPHPLPVRPVLGNHELHALWVTGATDPVSALIADLLEWGRGRAPDAGDAPGRFRPEVLASLSRLANPDVHRVVMAHGGTWPTRDHCQELADQMEEHVRETLAPGDRAELDRIGARARQLLADAPDPAALARRLAGEPGSGLVLEWLVWIAAAGREDLIAAAADPGHPLGTWVARSRGPAQAHIEALIRLAGLGNAGALPAWLAETSISTASGYRKSWRLMRERMIRRLGSSMTGGSSLEGLPIDDDDFVGPSWYRFDHPIPGSGGTVLRVIGLNSNLAHLGPGPSGLDQLEFLVSSIRSHDGPVVLFGHHPVVTAGHHGEDWEHDEEELIAATRRMIFVTLRSRLTGGEFDRIWAYVAGHDHDYQRFQDRAHGRLFLVAGGGGVPLRGRGVPVADVPRMLERAGQEMGATFDPDPVWRRAFQFVALEVTPDAMEFRVYGVCETGRSLPDRELARMLPEIVSGQLRDPTGLVDHLILRRPAGGGARRIDVRPHAGCP